MKRAFSLALVLLMISLVLFSSISCGSEKVKYIDIALTDEQYAFAVNKENTSLLETVNAVLDTITEDGTLESIVQKYFSGNEEQYKQVSSGIEDENKNQLIVATSIPFKPFEFSKYETGKGKLYRGIDIEIATYIASELDAELVIKEMAFSEVLDAVESGEADIAMSGISINEERKQQVAFSNTYYEASQILIARTNDNAFDGCRTRENVEDVLRSFDSSVIIGYQAETTSGLYLSGSQTPRSAGFNVTPKEYDTTLHAVQALINGEINYVIADEGSAKIIVSDFNR